MGGNEGGEPDSAGEGAGEEGMRGGRRRRKRKSKFQDQNIWTGGQSIVGRKGKDGEWIEVRCVAM